MKQDNNNDKFLNIAVIVGAGILFFRTADILAYFSPAILNDIIGSDMSFLYGLVTAAMVEGVALALHFNKRAAKSPEAQWVKWGLLAISGACQVFDGYVITDTLAQQTDTIKLVFQFGVPLVPLLIVVMIFAIGHLPELDEKPKPFVGLKNLPGQFRWIWEGSHGQPVKPAPKPRNEPQLILNTDAPAVLELKEVNKTSDFTGADRPES